MQLPFIDPGKLVQNAYIESFNGEFETNARTRNGSPAPGVSPTLATTQME